jgi:hypothetical protein
LPKLARKQVNKLPTLVQRHVEVQVSSGLVAEGKDRQPSVAFKRNKLAPTTKVVNLQIPWLFVTSPIAPRNHYMLCPSTPPAADFKDFKSSAGANELKWNVKMRVRPFALFVCLGLSKIVLNRHFAQPTI